MKKWFFIIFLIFFGHYLIAQNKTDNCACCSEFHDQFDFWIGEWTVYNVDGKEVGKNIITKQYDNCVLQEKWTSAAKNRGTSYNYYDKKDNTWNQVWIDNSGFSLTLKGKYNNGKMVLNSEMLEGKNGNYYNQITWTKNNDGSVTQTWDIYNEKNEKKREAFKGIYKKSTKPVRN